MRNAFLVHIGAMSLALGACGGEPGGTASEEQPGEMPIAEEVGVATADLTSCTRTELANVVVTCRGAIFSCDFRLMENNFDCAEGVVGQASTETLRDQPFKAAGDTFTTVATMLFGQPFEGKNGYGAVTIATQWGHAYASQHETWCWDGNGWVLGTWHLDPWTKQAVKHPGSECR